MAMPLLGAATKGMRHFAGPGLASPRRYRRRLREPARLMRGKARRARQTLGQSVAAATRARASRASVAFGVSRVSWSGVIVTGPWRCSLIHQLARRGASIAPVVVVNTHGEGRELAPQAGRIRVIALARSLQAAKFSLLVARESRGVVLWRSNDAGLLGSVITSQRPPKHHRTPSAASHRLVSDRIQAVNDVICGRMHFDSPPERITLGPSQAWRITEQEELSSLAAPLPPAGEKVKETGRSTIRPRLLLLLLLRASGETRH